MLNKTMYGGWDNRRLIGRISELEDALHEVIEMLEALRVRPIAFERQKKVLTSDE